MSAPLEQSREWNQDSQPQPFDRRQLIERAKRFEDELLHDLPLADALAFFDARQRMQHVQPERGEQIAAASVKRRSELTMLVQSRKLKFALNVGLDEGNRFEKLRVVQRAARLPNVPGFSCAGRANARAASAANRS